MTDNKSFSHTTGVARRVRGRTLAMAFAATAMLAASIAVGGPARAQESSATEGPELLSEWLKICNVDPKTNKKHCFVNREVTTETGQVLGSIMVQEVVGEKRKVLAYSIPLGLLIQPGVNIQVDKNKPTRGKIDVCLNSGCYGRVPIDEAFVASMKKGADLIITALNRQNKQINFRLSLNGFTASYDSEGLNPQQYQQAQKTLQEKLFEKAAAAREKLIEAQKEAKEKAE
ncbi:invasion associated locus B family protein [Rhodobium gokarnense]|uniref:Invasion protein IalB n=1 Tax=Rhodobium gokarnense TaxID=364296 RepID=A0ABT3HHA8_9HYPH|nr:invasion associated locus B family protein [Rhodobium gokarnense]MCW2309789.1 invasion protein IalB [Rhodobium gokarnense]